jgi:glycosyltransferase involved in cell wall biosynthesis
VRIAFLTDGSHPNGLRWAEYLAHLGETVAIFDFIDHPFVKNGVEHLPIGGRFRGSKLRYVLAHRAARRAILGWRADLVVGYRLVSWGYLAARTGIRPLVVAGQGQFLVPPGASLYGGHLVRAALRNADLIHAWSPAMRERMLGFGAISERIIVSPRGIQLDRYHADRPKTSRPTLISTRSLDPYYDNRTIISAIDKLRGEFPDLELSLAGRGTDEQPLRGLVSTLGLEANVQFPGFLDDAMLIGELERRWIYVAAVPTDGVSSSLLEAMACGCFPVVVDNDANKMWIDGSDRGELFPAGNADALAAAIRRAILSQDLRNRAKLSNRAIVEARADWDRNLRVFLGMYRELVARCAVGTGAATPTAPTSVLERPK